MEGEWCDCEEKKKGDKQSLWFILTLSYSYVSAILHIDPNSQKVGTL